LLVFGQEILNKQQIMKHVENVANSKLVPNFNLLC